MGAQKNNLIKKSDKLTTPFLVMVFSVLLVAMIGYFDYVTGPYLSLYIFYLIPVSITLWFIGGGASFVILAISVAAWFIDDIEVSLSFRHPLIPYWNLAVKIAFFIIFIYIISKLKKAFERERLFARIDYLTGISNRKDFFDLANKEISRTLRYKYALTVMYLDLDDFKRINDSLGHKAGDELLCLIAKTIQESIRLSDTAARIGGDEFAVLFPETGFEAAKTVIQRVRERLSKTLYNNRWSVTFSMGVVTCSSPPYDFDSIMAVADKLMYAAKRSGKNTFRHELLTVGKNPPPR